MKIKPLVIIILTALLFVTACTPAPAEQPANTSNQSETTVKEEKVEIVYWSVWTEPEPQAQVIAKWIEKFEAENPNITIKAVWNGRENQTKIRNAMTSGTTIDLMDLDADIVAGGLLMEGFGYPIDDLLTMTALDENVPLQDVFLPGMFDLHKVDGKVYLWPYVYNTIQFWYSGAAFDKAGVEKVPETWEEFIDAGLKLKEAGYDAIAMESTHVDFPMHFYTYLVERMKGTGFLLSAIEDKTGEMWRDPVFLEALKMERQMWETGIIPDEARGYVWPQGQQTLAVGQSAMELTGSWTPTELANSTPEDFGWGGFQFPAIEGGEGSINDLNAWLMSFMIMKDTKHPEQIKEFLRFIMTEENQKMMADEALVGVTRKNVDWSPVLADGQAAATNANEIFMHADGATAFHPEYYKNVLTFHHQPAFVGDISPEEFIENMVADSLKYWKTHDR